MTSKSSAAEQVSTDTQSDGEDPLIDGLSAAVKKLIARGKERGYLSEEEIAELHRRCEPKTSGEPLDAIDTESPAAGFDSSDDAD